MQRLKWIFSAVMLSTTAALAAGPSAPDAVPTTPPGHVDIGIDLQGIDPAIKPGDDFFGYANGSWLKRAQIPADRSSTGTFVEVRQLAERQTSELIRDVAREQPVPGSNERKIADYYAAYMDVANIEKRGLAPLRPALQRIDAIKTREDLAEVLGSQMRADVDPINSDKFHTENLFGLFVVQGLEDPSHNMAYLLQGGIAMPDRDYYLSQDKDMVEVRAKYLAYVTALLKLAGAPDAEMQAKAVIALETRIAQVQESLADSQDWRKGCNLWSMRDFAQKAPGLDWDAYFKAAGLGNQRRIDVWQPAAVAGIARLVGSEPIETWKRLLRYHAIDSAAPLLPKAYADLSFAFYGTVIQGTPQQQERWKRAVNATNGDLGDAVGQLYAKRYFPPSAKAKAEAMVKNILAAFDERLDTLAWMTPATRAKAKQKIAAMRVGMGYPDTWRDYRTLEVGS